jgi:hypothetical protein
MLFRIWTITQAVVDLLIAAALLWEFRKVKPGVKKTQRYAYTVSAVGTADHGTVATTGCSIAWPRGRSRPGQ